MDNNSPSGTSSLKHFLTIGSGSLVNMLISIITTPIITRLVDTTSYGQLAVYNIYVNVGLFIFCMGLDQSLIRFFYEKDNKEYRRSLLTKCWIIPVITIVVGFIISFSVSLALKGYVNISLGYIVVVWAGILSQVLYRISLILVRLQYKSKWYALITATYKIFFVIIALTLILTIRTNYFSLLVIATISSTVISTSVAIICERRLWIPVTDKQLLGLVNTEEIIRYGLPFIISAGVYAFYSAADKFCINLFCDYSEVGIYASANAIIGIFGLVQTTFNSLWYPMAMERFSKNPDDKEFHRQGCQIITIIMFLFGSLVILFKDVIIFFLGSSYRQAVYLLPFLAFYPIMYTISESTVHGIDFYKKSKWHIIISVVSLLANIVGNLILVPRIGGRGAAISTGMSYVLFFILRTTFSIRYYNVDYDLWKIMILIFTTILYAIKASFISFSLVDIVLFFVITILIVLLYKDTVIFSINYCLSSLKKRKANKKIA